MINFVGRFLTVMVAAMAAVIVPCLSSAAAEATLNVVTNSPSFTNGTGAIYLRLSPGHFTPAQGALLTVGRNYTLVASPSLKSLFVNWQVSGGTPVGTTNSAGLVFTMGPNTTVTANFITNIFLQMAGTYYGLYTSAATTPPADETSGMIYDLVLDTRGNYSCQIFGGGSSSSLSGTFTPEGIATNSYTNSLDNYVTVQFAINSTNAPRTIYGTVAGTNSILTNGTASPGWVSSIVAIAAATNASLTNTGVTNSSGIYTNGSSRAYTLVIPPDDASASTNGSPPGYGFACLTNTASTNTISSVTILGLLPDWTSISEVAPVNEAGTIPIYQNYFNTPDPGMLFGWLNLSNTPVAQAPSGTLTWIRKPSTRLGVYTNGFTNSTAVVGSTYINSTNVLTNLVSHTNLAGPGAQMVVASDSFPVSPLTNDLYAVGANFYSRTGTDVGSNIFYRGYIYPTRGNFVIEFTNQYRVARLAYGAILQNSNLITTDGVNSFTNLGAGFFYMGASRNPTNFGTITLRAK